MKMGDWKKFSIIGASLAVVGASFFLGIGVGYINRPAVDKVVNVLNKETTKPAEIDFSLFWDVWQKVETGYVDKSKIDRSKLVEGAIAGMVRSIGDPYTIFMPPQETKEFQQEIKGSFEGIGAEIGIRGGVLMIIAPLKGSPAESAGLKAGDKVLKIDETVTAELSVEQAVRLIRGERSTKVKLTIFRENDGEPKEIIITRDTIVVPNIQTEVKNGIFVLRLSHFSESSPTDFRKAVGEFRGSGATKMILDLRNNPGGFLAAAVDIASWFLPAGDVVVTEKWSDGNQEIYRSRGYRELESTPVMVLINQGSASASEILAGALRDQRGIKLVGEKTFGKGSVQELKELRGGASLKITIAKWFTPSDKSINENGLEPDIVVEAATSTEAADPVLEKAFDLLR